MFLNFKILINIKNKYLFIRNLKKIILKCYIIICCCFSLQSNSLFAHTEINTIATVADGYSIPIKIFLPENSSSKSPIYFFIHGGGWNGGTATEVPAASIPGDAGYLCDRLGIIYVGLAYRCKGNNGTFQKAIDDLQASVVWFLNKANDYNADVTRIGFGGSSAGSTLASVMVQKYENCKLLIGMEGMYNIVDLDPNLSHFPNEQSRMDYGLEDAAEQLKASAFYNLRQPTPPSTLLFHGKDDWLCHFSQSENFSQKIKDLGGESKLVPYENINHTCLNISYPKVFKNSILEIANHFIEEFQIPNIDVAQIDNELESNLTNRYPYDEFPVQLVYGIWKDPINRRGQYTFDDNGSTSFIDKNGNTFNYEYEVEGAKLLVSDNADTKTFYMRKNNVLYELITEDNSPEKSRVYNFDFRRNTSNSIVYVSATGAGTMDGTSEANAYGNFAAALVDINATGDKLIVIGTVAVESATIWNKNFAFTIEGKNATSTITGNGSTSRLFTLNQTTTIDVTFKDLTFSNYNTNLSGGGVLLSNNAGATVTFDNCIITGNSVSNGAGGGAILFANGNLTITGTTFKSNTSTDEGGAIMGLSGTITITNSVFESNSAATKGGAIYSSSANFTITGSTFYDNATTGIGNSDGGAAFNVAGAGSTNSITNCTFYQNTTARANQDYGTIRTDNGNTTVTNSLFYDNKIDNDAGGTSDWGSGPNGTQTFETSIAQWISTNIDNQDEGTGSITGIKGGAGTPADLTASNLIFNVSSGKVEYDAVDQGVDSPIDFGSDGNDAGAWNSGLTLSLEKEDFLATKISVYYNSVSKNLEVSHSIAEPISIEIYNVLGAKILTLKDVAKDQRVNANSLQTGIYILVGKTLTKFFSKKFLIN